MFDPHFVTLSRPTVCAEDLQAEVQHYISTMQKIGKNMNKYKCKLEGMRKLECTYNLIENKFHPHFHLVVSGKEAAEELRKQWMKANPTATLSANDVRECKDNIDKEGNPVSWAKELFKYFTKLSVKTGYQIDKHGNKFPVYGNMPSHALDTMLQALAKRRIFQPLGGLIKPISEEIEPTDALQIYRFDDETGEVLDLTNEWLYKPLEYDWFSVNDTQYLTGYKPKDVNLLLTPANVRFYAQRFDAVAMMLKAENISALFKEKRYLSIDVHGLAKVIKNDLPTKKRAV